jgi:hypothetical protein
VSDGKPGGSAPDQDGPDEATDGVSGGTEHVPASLAKLPRAMQLRALQMMHQAQGRSSHTSGQGPGGRDTS